MPADNTCELRLFRRAQFVDFLRSYKIFINGRQVGILARNSVLDLKVPSGALTIEARIDWCRSAPVTIDATPGQKIDLEVFNTRGALLAIWAIIAGSHSYLTVKQLPAA